MSVIPKKTTMKRLDPKPDVQKILNCTNNKTFASQQLLSQTKKKIMAVLEKNPQGINLRKFGMAFKEEFGERLVPSMFGFSNVMGMLRSLHDTVDMKLMESNNQMLLFPKSGKSKGKLYFIFIFHLFNFFALL